MEKDSVSGNVDIDLVLTEQQARRIGEQFRTKSRNQQKRSDIRNSSSKNVGKETVCISQDGGDISASWKNLFDNVDKNKEYIDELCHKKKISFLNEVRAKITLEEYKLFLEGLQVVKLAEGCRLQQQGKYHGYHYIIIEGSVGAYREKKGKDEERQLIEVFEYEVGELLVSNTLPTHKCNPYTNRAKRLSLVLRCGEQNLNRHVRRVWQRDFDELASVLSHNVLFRGITALQMKKYLPYCSLNRFKYSDLVYEEGDKIVELFIVLQGEVQVSCEREQKLNLQQAKNNFAVGFSSPNLYKLTHEYKQKKEIKIVRISKGELFGLQSEQVYGQNYHRYQVRVKSNVLRVLSMSLYLLRQIEMENAVVTENMRSYFDKVMSMHMKLVERYNSVTTLAPLRKKPKKHRKRKLKKKMEISLQWWGLAEKLEGSKKYRMPTPPKRQSQLRLVRKEPLLMQQRADKLQYFKRRLFEEEMEELQEEQGKENEVVSYPSVLIPKLQKVKIQMISTKPKVVNNAQRIKRKLVDYAKNGEVFCDKLQLQ